MKPSRRELSYLSLRKATNEVLDVDGGTNEVLEVESAPELLEVLVQSVSCLRSQLIQATNG